MKLDFTKMHGAGNDFIVINNMDEHIRLTEKQIALICDRHFGIGGDGLILVEPAEADAFFMNYYNSDGSVAEMCGNGMRCAAKFAIDGQIVSGSELFTVWTHAGRISVEKEDEMETGMVLKVGMGQVDFRSKAIPVISDLEEVIGETICFQDKKLTYGCASMGNPHMVVLVKQLESFPLEQAGAYFETHPMFPQKCNVSFVQIIDRTHIRMDTWERGAGRTLACGTGTCASVAVLNRMELLDNSVEAQLSGGKLIIDVNGADITMTGPAVSVFSGCIEV